MASNCYEAECYQPTLEDVGDLVNGWEQFLIGSAVGFDKQYFQKLVERLPQSTFHSKLKQITEDFDNLTGFLFHALLPSGVSEQGQQPDEEKENFTRPTVFKSVAAKLEELTDLELLSVYKGKKFTNFTDLADNIQRKTWDLIKWSAYLWFLRHLQSCEHQSVLKWVEENGKMLFEKFFQESNASGKTRFAIICEEDCVDMVKQLLQTNSVDEELKINLRDREKVLWISTHEMGPKISDIISERSDIFYIVPVNSKNSQMYGIHVPMYLPQNNDDREYPIKEEARKLEATLQKVGITCIPLPEDQAYTSRELHFEQLMPWLEKVLREDLQDPPCSLLFFSMACHGCHLNVADASMRFRPIKEIFQLLNEQFKEIPKVVVIQACAVHGKEFWKYTEDVSSFKLLDTTKEGMSMEDLHKTETHKTVLMMAAEEGKSYDFDPRIGTLLGSLETNIDLLVKSGETIVWKDLLHKAIGHNKDKYRDDKGNLTVQQTSYVLFPEKWIFMAPHSKLEIADSGGQDTNAEGDTY